MTIVVADDHDTNRKLLRVLLQSQGYQTLEAQNGLQALAMLHAARSPLVALIDWEMPEMSGIEVCLRARLGTYPSPMFLILLTVRDSTQDIVAGLQAGANDYITKPFDQPELLARVRIGVQMVELQKALLDRVQELNDALEKVKQLSGLLPICGYCHKIRDDHEKWHKLEAFVSSRTDAQFSHGFCPDCYETLVKPQLEHMGIKPDPT